MIDYGRGIGKMFGSLILIALIGAVSIISWVVYIIYGIFTDVEIRSTYKIRPSIELTTDGKEIDTIYIYKIK